MINYYFRLMSALGGEAAPEGGDGGDDQAKETSSDASSSIPEGKKWLEGVDPELISDPSLQAIQDIPTLVKSYVHAQKMVGKDKVVVPDKNSSEEDWKEFYRKAGVPDKDNYKVEFDEEDFDEEIINKINEIGYENNLTPQQTKTMIDFAKEHFSSKEAAELEALEQQEAEQLEALKEEWGDEGFNSNIAKAITVIDEFGTPEFKEYLNETGLGNDPQLIRLLANIGNNLKEDSFEPDSVAHLGMTKQAAQEEVDAILGNMDHPYWNQEHANHLSAQKRMNKLQEVLAK